MIKKERIRFVDESFHRLPLNADKSRRYAVDLGICKMFAFRWLPGSGDDDIHYYVSALPLVKSVDLEGAYAFLRKLEALNPDAVIGLLEIEQINELCEIGHDVGFSIKNCWTRSTYDDWHGRVDGYYSVRDGAEYIDKNNITDVYYVFGFKHRKMKPLILP